MIILDSSEVLKQLTGIIHEDTQQQKKSIDLTVSQIHKFTEAGSLDFGGSEFEAAKTKLIDPLKQSTNDNYGWWILNGGSYRTVFNESLQNLEDALLIISPHNHARGAGIIANINLMSVDGSLDTLSMNFQVPKVGCNIKENARFATLHVISE